MSGIGLFTPNFVRTLRTALFLADPEVRAPFAWIPLGRVGKLECPIHAIVFFASVASPLTTGTSLAIDGG